ncbi:MAG TPA: hypothetical protein VEP90_10115 [Methylomirabilota bacterium]|nr:hypothetical protein [Methylomirabilota bacterium]
MRDPFTLFYTSNATTTTTLTSTIAIHQGTHGVVSALPPSLSLFSLIVTIASILLCSVIAMYFYRSYRFSGFGYLLGLPTGFAILAASFVFEHLHVVYSYSYANESLENLFFWIQLSLQSEGFAFIALSYMLKNRDGSTSTINGLLPTASKILFSPHNWIHSSIKIREIIASVLPMILISIPLMVTISALFVQPILNETEIKDMSLYTTLFDIVVLGYIFVKCIKPLVKAANIKLLYIPAAFALLWLEQYSLIINYFDNNQFAFIGSIIVRLAGLGLFVYAIYYALAKGRSREMEIET